MIKKCHGMNNFNNLGLLYKTMEKKMKKQLADIDEAGGAKLSVT